MENRHILIIDDDPDILDALQLTLESEGFSVKTSPNADHIDKLICADEQKPDLIILDVLLSGNDGRSLCKKLKSHATTRCIPVIMISAHPDAERTVKAVGADAFLAKPFEVENLLQKVANHVALK